jgi:hypothetical protein
MAQTPDPAGLDRVSCPSAPVDVATLPTAASRYAAACEGGDGMACAIFAFHIDEEPALFPGHDPKALRARACSLGVAEVCE